MNSNITKFDKIHISLFILFLVSCISILGIYCYGDDIRGDEIFSIGFSNNTGFLFLTRGNLEEHSVNGWVSGDFIRSYYAVDKGESFNIINCVRQARDDVHPPLYFMLLNAFSSFFPGQATTIPGHLINIIVIMIMLIITYLIAYKITGNKFTAFIPAIMLIGTAGLETVTTYIRMYASFCTIVLISIYLCMLLTEERYDRKIIYFALGLITTTGTLTHYYYYVMCFCIFVTTAAILLIQKRKKTCIRYFISQFIGAIVSFALYPYVFRHILHSDRGEQAMENLGKTDKEFYLNHLKGFGETYNSELFNGHFSIYFTVILALFILAVILHIAKKRNIFDTLPNTQPIKDISLLAIPSLMYWCILFKISYSTRWLYISPTFAPIIMVLSIIMIWTVQTIIPNYNNAILLMIAMFFCILHLQSSIPQRIQNHSDFTTRMDTIKATSVHRDCIFIYDEWSDPHYGKDLELLNYNQIMFLNIDSLYSTDLGELFESRTDTGNDLALYIRNTIPDAQTVSEYICDEFRGNNPQVIPDDRFLIYNIDK